jgi:hypothetical protein
VLTLPVCAWSRLTVALISPVTASALLSRSNSSSCRLFPAARGQRLRLPAAIGVSVRLPVGRRLWWWLLLVTAVARRWPARVGQRFQFVAAIPARKR